MAYNFGRFGNPFEFGNDYMMTAANRTLRLSLRNIPAGVYLMFAPPHLDGVFPWVRFAWPPADFARPAGYIVEPIIGAIWLAPFVGSLALTCWRITARPIVWILVLSSAAILLFIAATGWSVQRYETDFLPFGVLAALGCAAAAVARFSASHRPVFLTLLTVAIAFGMIVNLALGISGPYDEMLENRPARYVRMARLFSPLQRYRLELNPDLNVTFHANIGRLPDRARKDLVTAGRSRHQYELYAEQSGDKLNLISRTGKTQPPPGTQGTRGLRGTSMSSTRPGMARCM